ncbi:threo-3-hydroxy-L-aspartate ammonia-lyase [Alcaligenaceae bacterium]|nr:threo-3-hydroxy-L-aspartate ammonia-lyase [Alcaligenaceae bacterium]
MTLSLPKYQDVQEAAERLRNVVHRTPVLTSQTLNGRLDAEVFFKCENLQRVGAFKFRGAYNAIARLGKPERDAGVVTFSSGNHGQAIARAARTLGVTATIVMPLDAPKAKRNAAASYGARIITYDRLTEDRELVAGALVEQEGLTLIPPFDHPDVIAGQGTAVMELLEDVGGLDAIFVPLGGGGLLAGSLLAAHAMAPECLVYGVEPLAGNDGQQSFNKGEIVRIDPPRSIADGALTQALGEYTFPIIKRYAHDILAVPDDKLISAMQFFAERMKIVVEPTGCLGAAAVLRETVPVRGMRVGVLLSGGNVDLASYAACLAHEF